MLGKSLKEYYCGFLLSALEDVNLSFIATEAKYPFSSD